jgi:DNA-binding transcriptional MerR regulator
VGDRSYLAIGDVLALLREEFPDVTISKIRFLESRGLLVPERTPSGYRKFYEPDVDRLRWILRQQREHFLPLKVIKGRLENGMSDPAAPTPALFEMGDPPPEREPEPALVGAPVAQVSTEGAGGTITALGPIGVVASPSNGTPAAGIVGSPAGEETGSYAAEASGASATSSTPSETATEGEHRPSAGHGPPDAAAITAKAAKAATEPPARRQRRHSAAAETSSGSPPVAAEGAPGGETGNPEGNVPEAKPRSRSTTRSTAGLPGASASGASLTVSELASASGLDVAGIDELENFGLIAGRLVAGVSCYDEEAVLVAKIAAGFAPYGIEARHLRIFKHAADRQTDLYAQVITPLLRQRNPEAHARAVTGLAELSELGEALMRCFSQATLRELTGG